MSIEKKSLDQDNLIYTILSKRQDIENEVDRILKKSHIKVNQEKKNQTIDFYFKICLLFFRS